ncbi:MAG: 50S ribosomal protein L11 methyltransferase [Wenzhouxiangellaceae bacterium]
MSWLQIALTLEREQCEAAEDLLLDWGALAITLEDEADEALLEPGPGETPLWSQLRLQALFTEDADSAAVARALVASGYLSTPTALDIRVVADQHWERAWMDRYQPIQCGQRLWIYPRHWPESDDPQRLVMRLDPGLAFGSGTHPTTGLCLGWLDNHDVSNLEVVDYGCGSGVLAIAAALCGARRVWCVDHDPQALLATVENASYNGVADRLVTCAPEELPQGRIDLVLANILAGVLINLRPTLSAIPRPGGHLVMSGMLSPQTGSVRNAYAGQFDQWQRQDRDEWSLLAAVRQ